MQIGLIGYGSVGKQLYNTLLENDYSPQDLFIFDDHLSSTEKPNVFKFNDFKRDEFKNIHFIPTLGYLSKRLKMELLEYLIAGNYNIFTFVHPTAFVSKNAKIGRGVIIYPLCNIDQGVIVEDGAIILNSSIVAHDSIVGKCSYLAPGVCVSGFVKIGQLCFLGSASALANNITIGNESTIAIGSCITKDIPENSFAIGNPFKIKNNITLT